MGEPAPDLLGHRPGVELSIRRACGPLSNGPLPASRRVGVPSGHPPALAASLFVRVNCKLALFGLEPLDTPPPPPVFPELAPQDLVITSTAGVIAVKLLCPADPGDNTVLRASPPQSAGVGLCREFRIIGMCPPPVAGLADITALYTGCFGLPPVGRRIFLRASTMVSGFESLPREFRALVPAP